MEHQNDMAIPVMVVEEQGLFRGGLRTVLESGGFRLVAEYGSPEAALEDETNVGELEPGTVVLCSLSATGWQELVRRLLLQTPGCPIVGVVDEVSDSVVIEALSHGVVGCVGRTLTPDQWVEAVRDAHQGALSASRTLTSYLGVARHALVTLAQPLQPRGLGPLAPVLGQRERLALASVSEGVPLETIGERMGMPQQGLHDVLESACRKLVARQRLIRILDRVR